MTTWPEAFVYVSVFALASGTVSKLFGWLASRNNLAAIRAAREAK